MSTLCTMEILFLMRGPFSFVIFFGPSLAARRSVVLINDCFCTQVSCGYDLLNDLIVC